MCYSGEALAIEECFQTRSPTHPLVDALDGLGWIGVLRNVVVSLWGRSVSKLAASPLPPPPLPSVIHNPPLPDDGFLCQHHSSLAQKLRPSSSSICRQLAGDDIHIVGERPVSAGGFADIWRGSLDTRQIAVKSYRRYLSFDLSRVCRVRDFHGLISWLTNC